jgi:hypothetical protein
MQRGIGIEQAISLLISGKDVFTMLQWNLQVKQINY